MPASPKNWALQKKMGINITRKFCTFLQLAWKYLGGFLISKFKLLGIPLLIIIIIASYQGNAFRYQPNYQLKTTQQVAELIVSNSNNQPFNFALLSKMGWGFS